MSGTSQPAGLDAVLALLATSGGNQYGGEAVSLLQHGLQTAALAEAADASAAMITAALLHDIGHLTDQTTTPAAASQEDREHEEQAAAFLATLFGPDVTEPIRLHVEAKRYLCAVDPDYPAGLSATSQRTLHLQGGALDATAAKAFIDKPYAQDAIRIRRWDDAAKDPTATPPGLDYFRTFAIAALKR